MLNRSDELLIGDLSSDVCSSDLLHNPGSIGRLIASSPRKSGHAVVPIPCRAKRERATASGHPLQRGMARWDRPTAAHPHVLRCPCCWPSCSRPFNPPSPTPPRKLTRSEGRRSGNICVRQFVSWWCL